MDSKVSNKRLLTNNVYSGGGGPGTYQPVLIISVKIEHFFHEDDIRGG